MRNFILGTIFGSIATGYFTGHIKVSSQGITFVGALSDSPAERVAQDIKYEPVGTNQSTSTPEEPS
jgi:hypothetical protein